MNRWKNPDIENNGTGLCTCKIVFKLHASLVNNGEQHNGHYILTELGGVVKIRFYFAFINSKRLVCSVVL